MKCAVFAGMAALLLATAGCGGPGGPASYLAVSSSEVDFVQWQASSNGQLQGTIISDTSSGTAPQETLSINSSPFTGTISGGSVTITFTGFLGISARVVGTLSGNALTLQLPQSDGTIRAATFTQADVSAFNQAVAGLHSRIRAINVQAAQAQAQAQQQQQAAQDRRTAQNDIATLRQDVGNLSGDLGKLASDVTQIDADLAGEKRDAAKGVNGPGGPQCYNLEQNVDYDVQQNVDYDVQQGLVYDLQQNLIPDLATVRQDIATVEGDLQTLTSDGIAAPAGASAAIASARRSIMQAIATANADIDQANADDTTAYAIANGMATAACSGPGEPPAPVRHIG